MPRLHDFEVPREHAGSRIRRPSGSRSKKPKSKGELPEEDKNKSEDELREEYRDIAERRIRLGLLLAEVATQNKIEVNQQRNAQRLDGGSPPFSRSGKSRVRLLHTNARCDGTHSRADAGRKSRRLHREQAKVTDKKISAEELLKMPEEME